MHTFKKLPKVSPNTKIDTATNGSKVLSRVPREQCSNYRRAGWRVLGTEVLEPARRRPANCLILQAAERGQFTGMKLFGKYTTKAVPLRPGLVDVRNRIRPPCLRTIPSLSQ